MPLKQGSIELSVPIADACGVHYRAQRLRLRLENDFELHLLADDLQGSLIGGNLGRSI